MWKDKSTSKSTLKGVEKFSFFWSITLLKSTFLLGTKVTWCVSVWRTSKSLECLMNAMLQVNKRPLRSHSGGHSSWDQQPVERPVMHVCLWLPHLCKQERPKWLASTLCWLLHCTGALRCGRLLCSALLRFISPCSNLMTVTGTFV